MPNLITVRNWGAGHGQVIHTFEVGAQYYTFTPATIALASVHEVQPHSTVPHLGAARMTVCNVVITAPQVVELWLQIDWDSDLPYGVCLLLSDA